MSLHIEARDGEIADRILLPETLCGQNISLKHF